MSETPREATPREGTPREATPREATPRESVWTRPDRRSRGPVPQHSRAEIVAVATALADQGGLAAVSMRAVAAALDTGAGSLYRYLSSRDDLLDLMIDAALSELPPGAPTTGDWLEGLVVVAREQLALYRRHPWLSEATRRMGAFGPNTIAHFERCLAIMAPLPRAASVKMEAVAVLTGVVSLFATPTPMNPPPDDPQAVQRQQAVAAQLFAMVDPVAHPHLTVAFTDPAPPPQEPDLFERTVRGVLRGLLG